MTGWLAFLQSVTFFVLSSNVALAAPSSGEERVRTLVESHERDQKTIQAISKSARDLFKGEGAITEIVEFAFDAATPIAQEGCGTCAVVGMLIEGALEDGLEAKDNKAKLIYDIASPALGYLYDDKRVFGHRAPDWFRLTVLSRYNVAFLSMFFANALEGASVSENANLIRQVAILGIPQLQAAVLMSVQWSEKDGSLLTEIAPYLTNPNAMKFLLLTAVPKLASNEASQVMSALIGTSKKRVQVDAVDQMIIDEKGRQLCTFPTEFLVLVIGSFEDVVRSQLAHKVLTDPRCLSNKQILHAYLDGAGKASLLTFVQSVIPLIDDVEDLAAKVASRIDWTDSIAVDTMTKLFMRERSAKWFEMLRSELARAAKINWDHAQAAWTQIRRFPQWRRHPELRLLALKHPLRSLGRALRGQPMTLEELIGFGPCSKYLK